MRIKGWKLTLLKTKGLQNRHFALCHNSVYKLLVLNVWFQPLIRILDKESALRDVKNYEFDGEIDFAEEDITIESEQNFNERNKTSGTSSTSETAPALDFDDFNLLELPQPKKEPAPRQNGIKTAKTFVEQREINADSARFDGLSPEMIEAIADKVVEKMSDKVIKKIVKEVISQMAEKK